MLLFFAKIRNILVVNNYLYIKNLIYMKTKKNTIRLTENELKNIITESVKNIIKENSFDYEYDENGEYETKEKAKVIDALYGIINSSNKIFSDFEEVYRNAQIISTFTDGNLEKAMPHVVDYCHKSTINLGQSLIFLQKFLQGYFSNEIENIKNL